jgi:nucleoside-diphosphate-sugar epimerase
VSHGRIAVTGVTGYVGSAVARAALAGGAELVALSRRPWSEAGEWRPYDLRGDPPPNLLAGIDVVVHCAYDLTVKDRAGIVRVNVDGTARLIKLAAARGVRVCLISSMSAYEGTRQIYGQAKLASERAVLAAGGEAIRLGLVYGGANGGMLGSLTEAIHRPVVPLVCGSSHQFTVHVDDMAAGVLKLTEPGVAVGEPVGLAHPEPVRFDRLLRDLAENAGRAPVFLRVPWQPIYGGMRLAETLRIALSLRADSLLGLACPATKVPRVDVWEELGVPIRAFRITP